MILASSLRFAWPLDISRQFVNRHPYGLIKNAVDSSHCSTSSSDKPSREMLSRRLALARPLSRMLRPPVPTLLASRPQRRWLTQADIDDPDMNGGYQNPPPISRQHRDPYGDWWDKQERRNFGEPIHEDNDVLGMFAPEDYNFYTTPQCFALIGCFVATFVAFLGVCSVTYPDRVAVDRGFEGGLDRELGGEGALLARTDDGID